MRRIPWAATLQVAGNVANICALAFLVWAYSNPYAPAPTPPPSPTQQPAADEKPVGARSPMTVLAGLTLIVGGVLNVAAVLIRRRQGADPPLMFFTHDEAIAKNPTLALQARELFENAGYKMTLGQSNVPRHAEGVWLHGGTFSERKFAAWGLETLGVTPKIDYADDHPPSLQVIVGAYDPLRRKADGIVGHDSLKADVDNLKSERDGFEQALLACKRQFALARLRWIAERAAASEMLPRVKIRFAEYSDFALAEAIKNIFDEHTKWPVTLDGSNQPVLRPSVDFKVIFLVAKFEVNSVLASIFEDGQLVSGKVGMRRDDHEDSSLVEVEVLPTVNA